MKVTIPESMQKRIRREAKALPVVPRRGDYFEFLASVPVEHQVAAEEVWNDWVTFHRELADAYIETLRNAPRPVNGNRKKPDSSPLSHSDNPMLEPKLSVVEAAKFLGIGTTRLREIVNDGEIAFVKMGGKYLFFERDLASFIQSRYVRTKPTSTTAIKNVSVPEHIRKSPLLTKKGKAA